VSGPPSKVTLIARDGDRTPPLYWNESRAAWTESAGTRYKSIGQARATIARFKLEGHVITHG
jgi:hypothetical protein